LILMANGATKNIKDIEPGEEVQTDDRGGVAKVIYNEERKANGRSLFGVNGLPAFFTEEHIIVAKTGLRCLNVEALIQEDPSYLGVVQPLSIGDELCVISDPMEKKDFKITSQKIASFSEQPVDSSTPVYNIVLSTGHTFFANGIYVSDLFPRLDRFPFSFKMLHWLWRERGQQLQDCFEKQLGRDRNSTSLSLIHQDLPFQDLFTRLKQTMDEFIKEQASFSSGSSARIGNLASIID